MQRLPVTAHWIPAFAGMTWWVGVVFQSCHPGEGRDPASTLMQRLPVTAHWIPAFAGMTRWVGAFFQSGHPGEG
jgi:hypothetical protein